MGMETPNSEQQETGGENILEKSEQDKADIELFNKLKGQAESAQSIEELVGGMEISGIEMTYFTEGGILKEAQTPGEKVKAVEQFAQIPCSTNEKGQVLFSAQEAILDALERLKK